MTFTKLMATPRESLTAALVEYWIDAAAYWQGCLAFYSNSTFDYQAEAERCLANAMAFV